MRLYVFAVFLLLAGLATAFYFIYLPLLQGQHSGTLAYSLRGVALGPCVCYLAVVMLFTDVRDGQILQPGPDGKKHFTSKGWAFLVGLIAVLSLTLAAWFLLLHQLGFRAA